GRNEFAQVKSRSTDRLAGNKARGPLAFGHSAGNLFARAYHLPVTGAFKRDIKIAERGANIRIPRAARAYVNYVAAGVEHDGPGIFELQFYGTAFFQRLRHHDADEVIAAARKITAADCFILDVLRRRAVHAHVGEPEIA